VSKLISGGTGDAFKIMDGLLALGELGSWVLVGVGAIGWVLTRRR
jgi:hypothetical protein